MSTDENGAKEGANSWPNRMSMLTAVRTASILEKLKQREILKQQGLLKKKSKRNIRDNIFAKMVEENEEPETLLDFIMHKIDEAFKNSIPMQQIHILPKTYYYTFGLLVNALFGLAFALFFYYNYISITTTPFISITKTDGCVEVTKSITGLFKATIDGFWEGDVDYSSNKALYQFQINGLSLNSATYRQYMQLIYDEVLVPIGDATSEMPLPFNLLYLMNYKKVFKINNFEQSFRFLGDPRMVFHHLNYATGMSSVAYNHTDSSNYTQYCYQLATVYYDFAAAELVLTYNPEAFLENCGNITEAKYLGYNNYFQNDFSLFLPFRTFSVAVSANLGIVTYTDLMTTYTPPNHIINYRGVTYAIEFKYDPAYPGMKKLVCIRNIAGFDSSAAVHITQYCFVRLDYRLAIPIITHYNGFTDCTDDTAEHDGFYLISGFLYFSSDKFHQSYDSTISLAQLNATIDFLSKYDTVDLTDKLTDAAICVSFINNQTISELNCQDALSLVCTGCVLIGASNEWDYHDFAISQDFYQLTNGACNNVAYNTTGFARLIATPPVQLTEKYYKCSSGGSAAILNSFGIAAGNTTGNMTSKLTNTLASLHAPYRIHPIFYIAFASNPLLFVKSARFAS